MAKRTSKRSNKKKRVITHQETPIQQDTGKTESHTRIKTQPQSRRKTTTYRNKIHLNNL